VAAVAAAAAAEEEEEEEEEEEDSFKADAVNEEAGSVETSDSVVRKLSQGISYRDGGCKGVCVCVCRVFIFKAPLSWCCECSIRKATQVVAPVSVW